MLRLTEIKLPLDHGPDALRAAILKRLGIAAGRLVGQAIFKRGVDARPPGPVRFVYTVDVEVADEPATLRRLGGHKHITRAPDMAYRFVTQAPPGGMATGRSRPVVVGTGPCGMFAGLVLAQMGFRPLILERGKAVRERTKDTFGLWRRGVLDPESNVQFGEGGAGTFSDGKLYSQIKDPRHLGRKVLEEFVKAGAPPRSSTSAGPTSARSGWWASSSSCGPRSSPWAARSASARVDDLELRDGKVAGVVLADGERIEAERVVLAVGHSARDTFVMLHRRGVLLEPKPFSVGFRIEHPQALIDRCRLGEAAGHPLLGAADYKLVHHGGNGRSVYSFCMCPGGTVVNAASEPGRVVTNGMSQYSRNERNANAGIVVGVTPADFAQRPGGAAGPGDEEDEALAGGPLAGVAFQRRWERRAFELGGGDYHAPGQLVGDFLAGRASTAFGSVQPSYSPGVRPCDLATSLPADILAAIRQALPAFDKQMKGFALRDAVLTGIETRTSSPVRITRDDASLQSLSTPGLYPAGEGAGYAGGILSAAVDGVRVAEAVALAIAGGGLADRSPH